MSTRTKKTKSKLTYQTAADLMPTSTKANLILDKRAEHIALEEIDETIENNHLSYVRFRLDNELYGIPYHTAKEIMHMSTLTKVPNVPKFVAGVLNRRGMLITVIDLKQFFNLTSTAYKEDAYILVVSSNGITIGFLADSIEGSQFYDTEALSTPLPATIGIKQDYILGLHQGLNALLKVEVILKEVTAQLTNHT